MSSEKAEAEARAANRATVTAAYWGEGGGFVDRLAALLDAKDLEASRESAALRETVARLEGEAAHYRGAAEFLVGAEKDAQALRSELVVAREALEEFVRMARAQLRHDAKAGLDCHRVEVLAYNTLTAMDIRAGATGGGEKP